MGTWTFLCFLSDGGRDVIRDWYDEQAPEVQAEFDVALSYLREQPPAQWVRPSFGTLRGKCAGLEEIRFKANKIQHRPIGFFGPEGMQFTLLLCATEKDRKFIPPSTCDTAQRRKAIVLNNKGRADECDF